jgi:hypothetical protein
MTSYAGQTLSSYVAYGLAGGGDHAIPLEKEPTEQKLTFSLTTADIHVIQLRNRHAVLN